MKQFPPEQKHSILLEYEARRAGGSFAALAARHGVAGGARTVQRWHARWDHTPLSLQHSPMSGRPRKLSRAQVVQHVRPPLLRANRAFRKIRYPKVAEAAREATGVEVSLRTVQRYGKEECQGKKGRGKKRTAAERQYSSTRESGRRAPRV